MACRYVIYVVVPPRRAAHNVLHLLDALVNLLLQGVFFIGRTPRKCPLWILQSTKSSLVAVLYIFETNIRMIQDFERSTSYTYSDFSQMVEWSTNSISIWIRWPEAARMRIVVVVTSLFLANVAFDSLTPDQKV